MGDVKLDGLGNRLAFVGSQRLDGGGGLDLNLARQVESGGSFVGNLESDLSGGGHSFGFCLKNLVRALAVELIPHLPTGVAVGIGHLVNRRLELLRGLGGIAGICHLDSPFVGV